VVLVQFLANLDRRQPSGIDPLHGAPNDLASVGSTAMPLKAPSPSCRMLAPTPMSQANQTAQASEVAGVGHDDVAGRVDRHGERLNEREAMSDLLIFAGRWVDECHTARTSGTLQQHQAGTGRDRRRCLERR
jgi:hypothetical protein